jgi:hypothetical protein
LDEVLVKVLKILLFSGQSGAIEFGVVNIIEGGSVKEIL